MRCNGSRIRNERTFNEKVIGLIFVPTVILTSAYVMIGLYWQKIPSIALFYVLATVILFLFAGAMSAIISPIENILVSPIAGWVEQLTPEYFDCTDVELTGSYSKEILLFTSIVFLIMNAFVGPIIEEFFLEDI